MSRRTPEKNAARVCAIGLGLALIGPSCAYSFTEWPAQGGSGGANSQASGSSTTATGTSATTGGSTTTGGPPGCGNGIVQPNEDCDDGNRRNLDGCDKSCKYEVVQRMDTLALSPQPGPPFCVHNNNQFGHIALSGIAALGVVNDQLAADLKDGNLSVLAQLVSLSDLTGTNASGFTFGVVGGVVDPNAGIWPSGQSAPEDWSFLADGDGLTNGVPNSQLSSGLITNHTLTAGPSTIHLNITLAGAYAKLIVNNAKVKATLSSTTSPPGPPPKAAQLKPNLVVFDSTSATGMDEGLCGDLTVQSLAQVPIPQTLTTSGGTPCNQAFKYCGAGMPVSASCNSVLDLLVVGCSVLAGPVVIPSQPDVAGGAAIVPLSDGGGHKVVVPANDGDSYSSYFTFTTLRQHITGQSCSASGPCQAGQSCMSGVCDPR
jgi:cysteine-rich repeat protein